MLILNKILDAVFPTNKRLTTDDNQVDNEIQNVIRGAGLTPEAEVSLTGTASSVGTAITGSGTQFLTELRVGDLFYKDSAKNDARRITNVASNVALTVDSAFDSDFSGQACSIFNVTQLLTAMPLLIPDATTLIKGIKYLNKRITLENGTDTAHDIDFGAGSFDFDDGTGQAKTTAMTKKIDAVFAIGTNAGGLDAGSVANNTWYYLYAIYNPTTDVNDYLFSVKYNRVDTPTMPAGYTKIKFLGTCLTDGSANILNGTWTGNYFEFIEPILEVNDAGPAVASTDLTVSIPPIDKIKVYIKIFGTTGFAGTDLLDVAVGKKTETLAITNNDLNLTGATSRTGSKYKFIPCVDGQIKYEVFTSANTRTLKIFTYGYTDYNL